MPATIDRLRRSTLAIEAARQAELLEAVREDRRLLLKTIRRHLSDEAGPFELSEVAVVVECRAGDTL